jgi:predicted metal-dependent hydrolase
MVIEQIEYNVKYRNIKYPRLEFKSGILEIIMPFGKDPQDIIAKHHSWICRTKRLIEKSITSSKEMNLVTRNKNEFRQLIIELADIYAKELRASINKIFFRKMRTKWASCSGRKNLTVNTMMGYLPRKLIDYIIYHEIAHLIERHHNAHFWRIIYTKFKSYQKYEAALFSYWFKIIDSLKEHILPQTRARNEH